MRRTYLPLIWLLFLGAFPLVVLFLIPSTGWIARSHLRSEFDLINPQSQADPAVDLIQSAAHRHPDDIDASAAALTCRSTRDEARDGEPAARAADSKLAELRKLILRAPDRPALYAHALRYLTVARVKLKRHDYEVMTGAASSAEEPLTAEESTDLAIFDRLAGVGERLEPDNAFFPAMRVVGLLARHSDAEAISALRRAAGKPRWDSHGDDALRDALRLAESEGRISARYLATPILSVYTPHLAQLRAAVRTLTALAVAAELRADIGSGLAVRHDAMRLGARMRFDETTAIGSLVGVAIVQVAASHPEGERGSRSDAQLSAEQRRQLLVERYSSYLNRRNRPQEAAWFEREAAAGLVVKQIVDRGPALSPIAAKVGPVTVLDVIALLMFANVLVAVTLLALWLLRVSVAAGAVLLIPMSIWQWRVATIWGTQFFQWTNLYEEKPHPIPGPIVYTTLVPLCLLAALIGCGLSIRLKLRSPETGPPSQSVSPLVAAICVAVWLYGAAVGCQAVQEEQVRAAVYNTAANEGRYFAKLTNTPWPAAPP